MASLNRSMTWLLLRCIAFISWTLTDASSSSKPLPISSDGTMLIANQFIQSNLSSQPLADHYIYKGRPDDGFVLFYATSQFYPITASLKQSTSSDYTLTSRNPGLIQVFNHQNDPQIANLYLSLPSSNDTKLQIQDPVLPPFVVTQVVAVPSKNFAPLPGGCCLTCDLDIDPNIILTSSFWITWVYFAEANAGFQNGNS